jgi:anti-anti-sigma regulatory factor
MMLDANDVTLVTLSGPITLYEITDVREKLLSALSQGKPLFIDLETSGPWDLAGLQLMVSAAASARKAGLMMRLVRVPGVCRGIADRSGLAGWLDEFDAAKAL